MRELVAVLLRTDDRGRAAFTRSEVLGILPILVLELGLPPDRPPPEILEMMGEFFEAAGVTATMDRAAMKSSIDRFLLEHPLSSELILELDRFLEGRAARDRELGKKVRDLLDLHTSYRPENFGRRASVPFNRFDLEKALRK